MAMTSSSMSLFQLPCCLIVLLILPFLSHAADPDPLQDICVADLNATISINGFPCKPASDVTSDDFFKDLSKEASNSETLADVFHFPGVNTQGLSFSRLDFAVGGTERPHTHPRASEADFVLSGKVNITFVTTDNKRFSKVLTAGMIFLIPRGLVHFQSNVGTEKASLLAIFNSQNPGHSDWIGTLFSAKPPIPNEILTKAFLVGDDVINAIRSAQPSD